LMPKLGQYSANVKPRSKYQRKYNSKHRADNAARKRARRLLEKQGRVRKHDGKDVDHRDGNPKNNGRRNLRLMSRSRNRAANR
jgi:hypothetical protein